MTLEKSSALLDGPSCRAKTEKRFKKDRSGETEVDLMTCFLCSKRLLLRFEQGAGECFLSKGLSTTARAVRERRLGTVLVVRERHWDTIVSTVRERRRDDIGLSGVGTPDRHRTGTQVSPHREKGTLCVARTCFQDWERLIA